MATEQKPHFLLIPYSEQGHINPMLSLASHLLRLGCLVTFVKADRHLPPPSASDNATTGTLSTAAADPAAAHEGPQLRFVTLPVRNKAMCVDVKTMTRFQIFKNTMAGLEDRQDLIAAIIEESKASSHPITCIICDILLWKWIRHIARLHPQLRSAALCVVSAISFYTRYLEAFDKEEEVEELLVSQYGMPSKKDSTTYFGLLNMQDSPELKLQKHKYFNSLYEGFEEIRTIFVNSFEALETPLLPSLQASGFDVRFIGPCLPEWHKDDASEGTSIKQQAGSIFIEDTTCLTWLDQQEKGSVLYVAFGSEGEMSAKQVEEIELGIKLSGHKFLWVVRPNSLESSKPIHGLCEQSNVQGKGIFVSWAPQKRVLQHSAVGGFLTHSGWNSTLESLTFGVPMLCLPLLVDHPLIASFVQDFLQVGIRLSVSKDGLVHKEEVASGVQVILQGSFSQNASRIQELAQLAIPMAHANLASFVQTLD